MKNIRDWKFQSGWTNEGVKTIIEHIISRFGGDLPHCVHYREEIHNKISHNKTNVISIPTKSIQTEQEWM